MSEFHRGGGLRRKQSKASHFKKEMPGRGIALSLEGGPGWEFVYLIMSQISSLQAVNASSRPVSQDGCFYTSAAAQSLNNVNQLSNWQRSGLCCTFVRVHPEWGRA